MSCRSLGKPGPSCVTQNPDVAFGKEPRTPWSHQRSRMAPLGLPHSIPNPPASPMKPDTPRALSPVLPFGLLQPETPSVLTNTHPNFLLVS